MQEGRVPQFIKSEPIPDANEEPVKVAVADSLDDLVTKSGKNGVYDTQLCRVHRIILHYIIRLLCIAMFACSILFHLCLFNVMRVPCTLSSLPSLSEKMLRDYF